MTLFLIFDKLVNFVFTSGSYLFFFSKGLITNGKKLSWNKHKICNYQGLKKMSKTKNKFIILLESTNDEKISKKQT